MTKNTDKSRKSKERHSLVNTTFRFSLQARTAVWTWLSRSKRLQNLQSISNLKVKSSGTRARNWSRIRAKRKNRTVASYEQSRSIFPGQKNFFTTASYQKKEANNYLDLIITPAKKDGNIVNKARLGLCVPRGGAWDFLGQRGLMVCAGYLIVLYCLI